VATVPREPTQELIEVGARRIAAEREFFAEHKMGEPTDEHLAANAYEAMVHYVATRGLKVA
jgi:hypothetical protein